MWKWSLCSAIALYSRAGTLTRPKTIEPDQIARGTFGPFPHAAEGQTAGDIDFGGHDSAGGDARAAPRVGDAALPAGPDAAQRGAHRRGRPGRGRGAAAPPGALADRQRADADGR